jgi:DNA-binding transcriptional regulator YiaG
MADMSSTLTVSELLRARRELPDPQTRRAIRVQAGLSLDDVAGELGVTRQSVSDWERGRRYPRRAHLVAYVALLRLLRAETTAA